VGGTRAHARRVVIVYAALTGLGFVALLLAGAGPFNAVVYTLSAVSTGGFSPHDASLGYFSGWAIPWLTTLACLAGSLPLALYHRGWLHGWKTLLADLQFRALLLFALAASVTLAFCLHLGHRLPWNQTLYHAPLMALSAQSTAGFATLAPGHLDASSKMALILTMAAGGGLGSTAGGIKLLRLVILLRLLQLTLVRTCLPAHAILEPRLGGRRLQDEEIQQALLLILLFIAVVTLSWLPFLALGYQPLDALFEVVSATGTVGLSAGVTGPELPALLKGVLCADMLMGRLEILAWLVILFPRTWIGKREEGL
jgi:trk system potassium uptake protein TrkH